MKLKPVLLLFLLFFFLSANAAARDEWITVSSKNFHLVGNASEKEVLRVAKKLEQFRTVFGLLFPKIRQNDSVGTTVFVFKNDKSFKPFLPKKANGKPDKGIAGYFLSTEESNYIALSTEGRKQETYKTIFHEYVHFLLNANFSRGEIPPWLNEGLAEYYSTFEIEDDQKVFLGNLRNDHLYFLNRSEFIPLRQFFKVDNYSLHQTGNHSRSVFYAQAWALMHYFANNKQLDRATKFIELSKDSEDTETAFKQAFGVDYDNMESILRDYVKQSKFTRLVARFGKKLVFDEDARIVPLKESESMANLGNLLYHKGHYSDAEKYLAQALTLDPDEARANTAAGLIKMRQRNFGDAKKYLEKAVASNVGYHYAHYSYAYVLSRESMDENGYVVGYDPAKAEKMRGALRKSLVLKPDFIPSYNLLAFIGLVTGDKLDESIADLKKVLSLQPGNERATLTLAQIYVLQSRLDEAQNLARRVLNSTDDGGNRVTAKTVLSRIRTVRNLEARNKRLRAQNDSEENHPGTLIVEQNDLTDEQLEKIREEREISMMNQSVLKPADGENQVVGYIKSIACVGNKVAYHILKVGGGEILLRSNGFQRLELLSLEKKANRLRVGCDAKLGNFKSVINYHPKQAGVSAGTLRSVTFVPDIFRIKTKEEIRNDTQRVIVRTSSEDTDSESGGDGLKREQIDGLILQSVKDSLRKPKQGESRLLGRVTKISCDSKGIAFQIETETGSMLFATSSPQGVPIIMLGVELGKDVGFGCGDTPPRRPVVVTYRPGKTTEHRDGELISLEFVPEGIRID